MSLIKPKSIEIKRLSNFISPFLINNYPVICLVDSDGLSLRYLIDNRKTDYELIEKLPEGTKITLDIPHRHIEAFLTEDILSYQADLEKVKQEKRLKQKMEYEQKSILIKKEATEFNLSLNIPFKWTVDHKVVMSGLSENSYGDGMNRRSVFHVRVLETYKDGKFIREEKDFLCGKDKSAHQGYTNINIDDKYNYKVTCKQCLKVAQRFNK